MLLHFILMTYLTCLESLYDWLDLINSNNRMVTRDEGGSGQFKIISWIFPDRTEGNHEIYQTGQLVSLLSILTVAQYSFHLCWPAQQEIFNCLYAAVQFYSALLWTIMIPREFFFFNSMLTFVMTSFVSEYILHDYLK
jgi:hypothetical protein